MKGKCGDIHSRSICYCNNYAARKILSEELASQLSMFVHSHFGRELPDPSARF